MFLFLYTSYTLLPWSPQINFLLLRLRGFTPSFCLLFANKINNCKKFLVFTVAAVGVNLCVQEGNGVMSHVQKKGSLKFFWPYALRSSFLLFLVYELQFFVYEIKLKLIFVWFRIKLPLFIAAFHIIYSTFTFFTRIRLKTFLTPPQFVCNTYTQPYTHTHTSSPTISR